MLRTAAELNQIEDEVLKAHTESVCASLSAETEPSVPVQASFITADVLLRLHNFIVDLRQSGNTCGGWSKQATLAKVVACFTGVLLKREDAEFIGNAEDYYLKDYLKALRKAKNTFAQQCARARKKGNQADVVEPRVLEDVQQRIYMCKHGGVPRHIRVEDGRYRQRDVPLHKQPVPLRRVECAETLNRKLQEEIVTLKQEGQHKERETQHNMNMLCQAVEAERSARLAAESLSADVQAFQESKAAAATAQALEFKHKIQQMTSELEQAQAQAYRLGSKVSMAHLEVAQARRCEEAARKRAEKARVEAEKMAAAAADAADVVMTVAAAAAASELQLLEERSKEAEQECVCALGEVDRLGCELVEAQREVTRALEREQQVRQEADDAAAIAASVQVEAVAQVSERLRRAQAQLRQERDGRRQADGQLARLGSQLGSALIEAARATEMAKEARTSVGQLQDRMQAQEAAAAEAVDRARMLKARMARRARDADARAAGADSLKADLDATRAKLRMVRKELNMTKVQLNLELTEEFDDELSDNEVSDAECSTAAVSASESEEDEADLALKRMRSMPTWKPVRGKGAGRGQAKMEWGTRLIIYSLLAMLVPPAAVGMAIVAIVRRTAPWLQPAAPTYETVKRCRFELRFVEEVCRCCIPL